MIDIGLIANKSSVQSYDEGTVIIKEGLEKPFSMFVILNGKVAVYRNHETAEEEQLSTLEAGDFFGEMSLFLERPRCATVIALEPVVALKISQQNVLELCKAHPQTFIEIMEVMCRRVFENDEVALEIPNILE